MKCFLVTLLFFSIAVVAYSQASLPGRENQCYKSSFGNTSFAKGNGLNPTGGQSSKSSTPAHSSSSRNEMPVISVMPTLKLWV